jgi:hypothetical protein
MRHPRPDPTRPPLLLAVPTCAPTIVPVFGHAYGNPGASAAAHYRRRRAAEWTLYQRTLPLRLVGIAVAAMVAGLAVGQLRPALVGWAAVLAAAVVGWRLRFQVSQDGRNWLRGARGERRTARQLRPLLQHGWVVFHDLAVPESGANADHLVIGPGGIFLVDSKNWHGPLLLGPDGTLWHGSYPVTVTLATIGFEAAAIADALGVPGRNIQPMMVVHGGAIPWGEQYLGGVAVLPARQLAATLLALPPQLSNHQITRLANRALAQLHPAA